MRTQTPSTVVEARAQGDWLANLAADRAEIDGMRFRELARDFVLRHLSGGKQATGEDIVDAAEAAGITAPDARAFGAVFGALARRQQIRCAGFAMRRKGNGTAGARVWELNT
jgi:hypothetical protein